MTALVAGLGAMAVLRTKFFTLRTEGGEDVSIGPDAMLSAFLFAADRGVDRIRAARRLRIVDDSLEGMTDLAGTKDYIQVALAAFQNLSTEEKQTLSDEINDI